MPAIDDDRIEPLFRNQRFELGGVEAAESSDRRPVRHVAQEPVGVSFEQRNIPRERHPESRPGLLGRSGIAAVEHLQIQARVEGHRSKPPGVVLDRVAGQKADPHPAIVLLHRIQWETQQSVVKVQRRTEAGEAPRRQGATTENIGHI